MSFEKDSLKAWMNKGNKYVKIPEGSSYEGFFLGMKFDPTGGYQGKPTVVYSFKDSDGSEKQFSSTSKALARELDKIMAGDLIRITAGQANGRKAYHVTVLSQSKAHGETDELIDAIVNSKDDEVLEDDNFID